MQRKDPKGNWSFVSHWQGQRAARMPLFLGASCQAPAHCGPGSMSDTELKYFQVEPWTELWPECLCAPNSYTEALAPRVMASGGGAFGRGLGQEVGALKISALIRRDRRAASPSPSSPKSPHPQPQHEGSICQPGSRPSSNTLILLDIPASRPGGTHSVV